MWAQHSRECSLFGPAATPMTQFWHEVQLVTEHTGPEAEVGAAVGDVQGQGPGAEGRAQHLPRVVCQRRRVGVHHRLAPVHDPAGAARGGAHMSRQHGVGVVQLHVSANMLGNGGNRHLKRVGHGAGQGFKHSGQRCPFLLLKPLPYGPVQCMPGWARVPDCSTLTTDKSQSNTRADSSCARHRTSIRCSKGAQRRARSSAAAQGTPPQCSDLPRSRWPYGKTHAEADSTHMVNSASLFGFSHSNTCPECAACHVGKPVCCAGSGQQ